MSTYRIRFDELAWEHTRTGARFKAIAKGSRQIRLVELTPALSHPEWCSIGHEGYVLDGRLAIQFGDETVHYRAGDGIMIPSGEAHQHIPRAPTDTVTLILVENT